MPNTTIQVYTVQKLIKIIGDELVDIAHTPARTIYSSGYLTQGIFSWLISTQHCCSVESFDRARTEQDQPEIIL